MNTTFQYEIVFEHDLPDDEMTVFCDMLDEAVNIRKLIVWNAIGVNFIKGFVEYSLSDMNKEDAMEFFKQKVLELNYKSEVKTSEGIQLK